MTQNSDNDADNAENPHFDDAFEDILFNDDVADESIQHIIEQREESSSNFSVDESFDDILFAEESAAEQIVAKASEENQRKATEPTSEKPKDIAEKTLPTPKRKVNTASATEIDIPEGDDSFLEGALFSDDELADSDDEFGPAQTPVANIQDTSNEDNDFAEHALFSSDEEFEEASDYHPDELQTRRNVVKAVDKSVELPNDEYQAKINVNFQSFLSKASQADAFLGKPSALQRQLIAENDAINDSFPLIEIDKKSFLDEPVKTTEVKKEQKPKDAKAKAKFFALKAKNNLSDLVGGDLPERTIALDYKFARQKGKKDLGEAPSRRDILIYLSKKGATLTTLLKRSENDITLIAKYHLSSGERERLLETFLPLFFAKVPQLLASFERKPFDPKNVERYEQLNLSLSSLKGLIAGYKQIYSEYYQQNNFNYKRNQNEANNAAFNLAQLLYLEQRLMYAAKTDLPANSIKTFNKLALVVRHYEPAFFAEMQDCAIDKQPRSIALLWKKYQLLQCFDHLSISTCINSALLAYIDFHVFDKLEIIDIDGFSRGRGGPLAKYHLFCV